MEPRVLALVPGHLLCPETGAISFRLSLSEKETLAFYRKRQSEKFEGGYIMANKSMETIVSLAKHRGFVFPGSEIYGGLANTWDYGPLGVELKKIILKKSMVAKICSRI